MTLTHEQEPHFSHAVLERVTKQGVAVEVAEAAFCGCASELYSDDFLCVYTTEHVERAGSMRLSRLVVSLSLSTCFLPACLVTYIIHCIVVV